MNYTITNKMLESYFRFMQNWDSESKKNLIIKLTKSMETKSVDKQDFSSSYGAWVDDRTADQIIADLRSDRVNKNDIENF